MRTMNMPRLHLLRPSLAGLALTVLIAGPGLAQASPDEAPAITPYRPSVSSPAQLPITGQLEMELGGLHQRSGDAHRSSLPYQLKLAFSQDWGLLLGGEAQVSTRDSSGSERGLGDTTVVLKRAWTLDDATALGMELGTKLPTAGRTLGSGEADYTLNTIYSRDIGAVHLDANLNAARLGQADPGTSHTQWGWSTSLSTPLSDHWGATGEVSGTHRDGAGVSTQVLGALTYSPSKRLTFDVGAARAAHPNPGTTSVFAGVVFPVAQLW
jgi:hypothetical protein